MILTSQQEFASHPTSKMGKSFSNEVIWEGRGVHTWLAMLSNQTQLLSGGKDHLCWRRLHVETVDHRICGLQSLWIVESVDCRVCGLQNLWIVGFVDCRICGLQSLWIVESEKSGDCRVAEWRISLQEEPGDMIILRTYSTPARTIPSYRGDPWVGRG